MSNTKWHALSAAEILNKLATNLQQGLTSPDDLDRQKTYGRKQIVIYQQDNMLLRFLRQFHHALVYILLASAAITIYLAQWVDASVILGVVILNAIFGFFQEGKAEKALSAIRAMLAPTAQVIRNGKKIIISASELVPGDVVVINRGDKIPADLRLCEARNLQIQQSLLTGESLPVEKRVEQASEDVAVSERHSMLYSSTLVTDGRGLGVVVATGG